MAQAPNMRLYLPTYLRPCGLSGLAGVYRIKHRAVDVHIAVNSSLRLAGTRLSVQIGGRTVCSCLTSQVRWHVDVCQVKTGFSELPKSIFLAQSYMRLNEIK